MRIVCLVENTGGAAKCPAEHGLSLYIEADGRRILMDAGASPLIAANADRLGIDLSSVDLAVLSHGHYDHGGGLPAFSKSNHSAPIYVQSSAFGDFYSDHGLKEGLVYIGLPDPVRGLPRLRLIDGSLEIDRSISVFSGISGARPFPSANRTLKMKTGDALRNDDFRHEQCLVVRENGVTALFSGCAHHGIMNVLSRYSELYGGEPDYVFSGFHMKKRGGYTVEDVREVIDTASELKRMHTCFYTGHCTGRGPYAVMREIMGSRLHYMHCGDEVLLSEAVPEGCVSTDECNLQLHDG